MVVGICRISFRLPGTRSLKEKRSIVRRLVERSRSRFNAAVAEVEDNDVLQRATIGFVVVSSSRVHAQQMIGRVAGFIEGMGLAVPLDREIDIMSFGGAFAPVSLAEAEARGEDDGDAEGDGDDDDDETAEEA